MRGIEVRHGLRWPGRAVGMGQRQGQKERDSLGEDQDKDSPQPSKDIAVMPL